MAKDKRENRDLHALDENGMVLCNPRDKEAAHRAQMEGIATEDRATVTCRKCLKLQYKNDRTQKGGRCTSGIDMSTQDAEDISMKTIEQTELDADTQAIIEHALTGKPLDPEIARRVREDGENLRRDLLQKHGLVDIAVPAIRELRGELPDT